MESPFLTKKIKQKFPQLPGYVIPENQLRATGDTEIEINSNGTYILGQNDQDPDDLEMDEELTSNPNQSLILSKTGTRDTTPTFVLGKFNVNVPQSLVNNYTQPTITTNGTYTIPNGYTGFNDISVNVQQQLKLSISKIQSQYNGTFANNDTNSDWQFLSNSQSISVQKGYSVLTITKDYSKYSIYYRWSIDAAMNISFSANCWVFIKKVSYSSDINFYDINNKLIFGIVDPYDDDIGVRATINGNFIDFSGIDWMTFN